MLIDIKDYIQSAKPKNVLNVIDHEVLENFIAGYSHLAFSGCSVFFKVCDGFPRKDEDIEYVAAGGKEASELYHPLCRYWRITCGQNQPCEVFDRRNVRTYYKNQDKGPMLYRCHRNLWDMTYPLKVSENLVGILFAGQIIVREKEVNWRKVLTEIEQYVDWESFDESHKNQQKDILKSLAQQESGFTPEQQTQSQVIIDENNKKGRDAKNIGVNDLVQRFKDFLRFGEVIKSLLEQLYDSKVHGAEQVLLRQMANELTRTTTDTKQWWESLVTVMRDFQRATGVEGFDVYTRKHSTYVQRISSSETIVGEKAKRIPVNVCIELPAERLIALEEIPRTDDIRRYLNPKDTPYLYRCDLAGPDNQITSAMILTRGEKREESLYDFILEFCRMVGLRADVSTVQHQIEKDRTEYRRRVRRISHSVKTPLQTALNEARRSKRKLQKILLKTELSKGLKTEVENRLGIMRDNIKRARGEMLGLHAKVDLPRRPADIRGFVHKLTTELEPLADEKKCWFELDIGDESLTCRVREDEIRIAIRNLMDNAIKFSFDRHAIKILAKKTASQTAFIQISNYGVGIPKEKMNAITELGERGGVVDRERPSEKRLGTGLGLPIAMQIIHEHGGTIDIESYAPDRGWREEHMRYVTRVDVHLPLHISI